MGVNKVALNDAVNGEQVIVDMTNATVTPETLAKDVTAYDANGDLITGEMVQQESNIIESGQCGENVFWELYENGLLVISGSGATYDYEGTTNRSDFYGRSDFKDVVIKDGVTTIGNYLFAVSRLENIIIPDNVEFIGISAFGICDRLKAITIPSRCTKITAGAFLLCKNLSKIIIPNSITEIEKNAFADSNYLLDVFYTGTKEQWDSIIIEEDNEILINATLHCQYDPNADTVDGWNVQVLSDGSDPENITKPTITFVYTAR